MKARLLKKIRSRYTYVFCSGIDYGRVITKANNGKCKTYPNVHDCVMGIVLDMLPFFLWEKLLDKHWNNRIHRKFNTAYKRNLRCKISGKVV